MKSPLNSSVFSAYRLIFGLAWLSASMGVVQRCAAEAPPTGVKAAAARLTAATVTVRMLAPKQVAQPHESEPSESASIAALPMDVSIVSGVALEHGLIVSYLRPASDARFRLTLPDGAQAAGELCVEDRYSGLILLEAVDVDLAGLELATETPQPGDYVLTAAAAGIEAPAVSLGIFSGADRSLPGLRLPPLLQCDVRTTETSCGAPLVNLDGQLVGVVAVPSEDAKGWTYAAPVECVNRLVRARVPNKRVLIERRRPVLGMTLAAGSELGQVKVERVSKDGPADLVGIRDQDLVVAAEGRKVRSAYQVQSIALRKQPGDVMTLIVDRDGELMTFHVTLAGGGVIEEEPTLPPDPRSIGIVVGPGSDPTSSPGKVVEDEVELLRRQLAAFEKIVNGLEAQLAERIEQQRRTEEQVAALMQEIARLKDELAARDQNESPSPPNQ